jgi:hypothetical protein
MTAPTIALCRKGCGQRAVARGYCSPHYAGYRYNQVAMGRWLPRVDSVGISRRLQALVALGYNTVELGRLLDRSPAWVSQLLHNRKPKVNGDTARDVIELYDQLSMTPGPSQQARDRAIRRGWMPPLAWDEDTIDDPAAAPNPGHQERVGFTERFLELRELGYSDLEILGRWKLKPNSLLRQLMRYDIPASPELANLASSEKHRQSRAS